MNFIFLLLLLGRWWRGKKAVRNMSRCDSLNCPFHDIFCKIWSCMWMACVCVSNVKWQQVERGRRVDISTHDFSPFSLPNETFYDPKQKFLCHRMPENHVDIERQWTRYVIGSEIIEWKLSSSNPQANIIAIKWEKVLKIFIWADTWHFHTESIAIQKHCSVKRVYNCEWMDYEGLLLLVWIIKEKWKLESLEITSHNRILEGFDLKSYKECKRFSKSDKVSYLSQSFNLLSWKCDKVEEMKLVRKVSR